MAVSFTEANFYDLTTQRCLYHLDTRNRRLDSRRAYCRIGQGMMCVYNDALEFYHSGSATPENMADRLFPKDEHLIATIRNMAMHAKGLLVLTDNCLYLVPDMKRKAEAELTEKTKALEAAETALALQPMDLKRQVKVCQALEILITLFADKKRYPQMLELLERDFTIREGWESAIDRPLRWTACSPGQSDVSASLRIAIVTCPRDDPNLAGRLQTIRGRFRKMFWQDNTKLNEEHRSGFGYLQKANVDLWAGNANEWLDGIVAVDNQFPSALQWVNITGLFKDHCFFRIQDLSTAGKQKLMKVYVEWAHRGALNSYLCAAWLAQHYPDVFPHSPALVTEFLQQGAELAGKEGPGAIYWFHDQVCLGRGGWSFPEEVLVPILRQLAANAEKQKVVVPDLLITLDCHDKTGAYLQEALELLHDPQYRATDLRYENPVDHVGLRRGGINVDWRAEYIGQISQQISRYGTNLPSRKVSTAP